MKSLKPMRAAKATIKDVQFLLRIGPMIATPKYDGIRCLVHEGKLLSRSMKPIRNRFITDDMPYHLIEGFDGELMCKGTFQDVTSGIMTAAGEPDYSFWVFDDHQRTCTYEEAIEFLTTYFKVARKKYTKAFTRIQLVPTKLITTMAEFEAAEDEYLNQGYEGIMLRRPRGKYKFGQSTMGEAGMVKFKRFEDSEGVITAAEPLQHNSNAQARNELGYAKRSSHKAGMVPKDTLGSLTVTDKGKGWTFGLGGGPGLTADERARLWALHKEGKLIGLLAKYKYFPKGVKDGPRFPGYLGIRDKRDL